MSFKLILPMNWHSEFSNSIPNTDFKWNYRPAVSFASSRILLPQYCVHCKNDIPEQSYEEHWKANPECSIEDAHRR